VTKYLVRRVLGAIPLVFGIATIVFFVVNLAPGDPTLYLISPGMTQEVIEQMRVNFGLDQPVYVRYVKWLGAMLTGDFGYSFSYSRPVLDVLMDFLPNTLVLTGIALGAAFLDRQGKPLQAGGGAGWDVRLGATRRPSPRRRSRRSDPVGPPERPAR